MKIKISESFKMNCPEHNCYNMPWKLAEEHLERYHDGAILNQIVRDSKKQLKKEIKNVRNK